MAQLRPKLTPFWYTPEGQDEDPAEFKLRPLTQPQIVELFETFRDNHPTGVTWYRAGEMAIVDIRNLSDSEGRAVSWPKHKAHIPYSWISSCGAKIYVESMGLTDESDEGIEKN